MTERFSQSQTAQMTAKLDGGAVRKREQGGRQLSYVEGYHVINEANRIFGFGSWSTDVLDLRCVEATAQGVPNYKGNQGDGYLIAYTATVRVTVHHEAGDQTHTDVGYGEGIEYRNVGQAHESAIKEAVTDAEKRALRHWGNPFGLALYDKDQRDVEKGGAATPTPQRPQEAQGAASAKPDDRKVTDAQVKRLYALLREHGVGETAAKNAMKKATGKESFRDLVRGEYDRFCAWIEKQQPETRAPPPAAETAAEEEHGSDDDPLFARREEG
ncbi:MAG: RAD52 family DNA repair protein [Dehalococcoidia bacterium]|nr:RAD52 family DNA repair protein [Dehalococcoidia bacterium]